MKLTDRIMKNRLDMAMPLIEITFTAKGFTPILTSGNLDDNNELHRVLACEEKIYYGKRYVICQVDLRQENSVAKRFIKKCLNERKDSMK